MAKTAMPVEFHEDKGSACLGHKASPEWRNGVTGSARQSYKEA